MDLKKAYRIQQYGYQRAEEDRVHRLKTQTHENWLQSLRNVHTVREPDKYLFRVASKLQKSLRQEEIVFCFIGGVALQYWGETRFTNDIDLTVLSDLGQELETLDKLRRIVQPRMKDFIHLAQTGRMYLGISPDNVEVDISMGFTPYEIRMMERAVDVDFGVDTPLHCCSAEDLVVLKSVAGRDQDWVDLHRIIQRSGNKMDWDLVFRELKPLLELTHSPESASRLQEMVDREI